ncbi:hypothetical protein METBIDRAFT_21125, partial [Metschnikowia bicuspidata var. bicuspidata NRRL YB-4993]
ISREQTPDTVDEAASSYTDLVPGSPGSGNEEGQNHNAAYLLDTDRAVVKKTITDGSPENVQNIPLAVKETHRKRVTSKLIEKQWETLGNETFTSFEKLCGISMNNVLERFTHSKQSHSKISETQRILTQHWLSTKLPKSFSARLKVTKLPPLKSLIVRMRGDKEASFDPLNIDQVKLRKTVLETYLLAELKQLESLESYRSSLQGAYDLDLEYLNDFKKTTSKLRGQISQERNKNARELRFEPENSQKIDIQLAQKAPLINTATLARARFDPDEDGDVKQLLDELHDEVSKLDSRKREMLDLCDQLDIIEHQL